MRGTLTLPDGYAGAVQHRPGQKDKRLALLINGLALLIALPLVFLGNRIVPLRTLFSMDDGFGFYFLRLGMLTAGYAAYVVLHELVHGVCMKYFSGAPVRYGFTGLYAYARSEAYFTKKRYFIIALAPVAVWGVVLLALCMLVPAPWFWTVYLIQIGNIAGAAGDFYVVWRFAAMPPDILVRDAGVDMTVYSRGVKYRLNDICGGSICVLPPLFLRTGLDFYLLQV